MWWIVDLLDNSKIVGFDFENDAEYELCHNYNQIEYRIMYELIGDDYD